MKILFSPNSFEFLTFLIFVVSFSIYSSPGQGQEQTQTDKQDPTVSNMNDLNIWFEMNSKQL